MCYFHAMAKRGKKRPETGFGLDDKTVWPEDWQDSGREAFAIRPFKKISAKASRQGAGESREAENKADQELFLKAVLKNDTPRKSEKAPGFTLAERCGLPSPEPAKKIKRPAPPPRPKKAEIQDDEEAAFLLAMRKTTPLPQKGRSLAPKPELKESASKERGFEELLASQNEFSLHYSDEYMEGRVISLDEMVMNQLRQGRLSPEAHLDLHGLNAEQAFETLRAFIRDAWFKGLRVVLLVPGRGKNSPFGQSVLRRKLLEWLTHEPFKRVVLAFCTAQACDGGPGSVYALLRKFRKKGRISWDSMSSDPDLYDL